VLEAPLLIALAATALVAGVTGAFSPCGFSMVETIGSALGASRRSATRLACLTFSLGAGLGGVLTFGGLALLGRLLGDESSALARSLGASIALVAAIADWRGVRIAPQIRRQVPERWRWTMPLPLASALYGALLGLGFTTFVLSFAVWALAGLAVAIGSLPFGVSVGLAFGVGRALPVVWLAPRWHAGKGAAELERIAAEPRLWLGLRRLDALGLLLCAALTGGVAASAFTLRGGSDPSVGEGALAWQPLSGPGMMRLPSGVQRALPGVDPALGGSLIAWRSGDQITVATLATMTPRLVMSVQEATALTVSGGWLVYRGQDADGHDDLVAVPLADPARRHDVAGPRPPGQLGRPALAGADLVFAIDTPQGSAIERVNLATGRRRTLRAARQGVMFANPALLHGRLLYERTDRCTQQLLLGSSRGARRERVLLALASTVARDPGYERGYEHAWNSASLCGHRASGRGSRVRLGPTALGAHAAYVTEIGGGESRILRVRRR
jgi:hypothetical protein